MKTGKGLALTFALLFALVISSSTKTNCAESISSGAGSFRFVDAKGIPEKPIRVFYFRPPNLRQNSPVVFIIHGVNRDAERYLKDWSAYAQQYNFLLVCPQFDEENYSSKAFQQGNLYDESGRAIPRSRWAYTTIENLFDYVKILSGNNSPGYYIYGHSAGGQFVHRLALLLPQARYYRAIAANAGWYTMPNTIMRYPYGLRDTTISATELRGSFARNFTVLLGGEDTDSQDSNLSQTPFAKAQGATRLVRGETFYRIARTQATALRAPFAWQIEIVPGAHHHDNEMAQRAAAIFFSR